MSYPSIPLAYVPFLSSICAMRNDMPADRINVIGIAHHNESVRHSAWAIEEGNSAHWFEMVNGLVNLYNAGPVDTMAVFFPTSDKGISAGYLVEGGKPNMYLAWRHDDGGFEIRLAPSEQLSKAEGIDTLKQLLDRQAGVPLPGLPSTPTVKFDGFTPSVVPANS